jgi:hypothetical protein
MRIEVGCSGFNPSAMLGLIEANNLDRAERTVDAARKVTPAAPGFLNRVDRVDDYFSTCQQRSLGYLVRDGVGG